MIRRGYSYQSERQEGEDPKQRKWLETNATVELEPEPSTLPKKRRTSIVTANLPPKEKLMSRVHGRISE